MKKLFLSLALCCAFALCCAPAGAAERGQAGKPGNAVDQLTGALWQQATDVEKLSFLLGVESAITVERFVNDRLEERSAQAGKPPVSTLSPFEKGWMTAFRDTSRTDIAKLVDALNYDESISALLDPQQRIMNLLERHNRGEKI